MNEDFVTYELAVKLKEKGFDMLCIYAYCEKGGWNKYKQEREPIIYILRTDGNPFGSFYRGKNWNVKYETNKNKIRCSAPTIAQVLKWLREEKKIHIIIPASFDEGYWWEVRDFNREISEYTDEEYKSYEQAAVAAISYVLDKLFSYDTSEVLKEVVDKEI